MPTDRHAIVVEWESRGPGWRPGWRVRTRMVEAGVEVGAEEKDRKDEMGQGAAVRRPAPS